MENVIRFYMYFSRLKDKLRTGWLDVKISAERIESVAEHTFECMILAFIINSEFKLVLNMERVFKMLLLHETEEIIMPDYSALATVSKEERNEMSKLVVEKIFGCLSDKEEFDSIVNEFNDSLTKEAKFCKLIDKIQADFQAKMYDLGGYFDIELEKEDCRAWCGDKAEEMIASSTSASDIWLKADEYIYQDDELFSSIQKSIKEISENQYNEIMKDSVNDEH